MKTCPWCGVTRPLEDFHYRDRQKGTRQHICGECFTVYRREHYRRNRGAYVERNGRLLRTRRLEWQRRLWAYLQDHPCVDCGERDPLVLEFDHIDPATKLHDVNQLTVRGFAWSTVLMELEKCEVRCANCHRRRTAAQFNWPKIDSQR